MKINLAKLDKKIGLAIKDVGRLADLNELNAYIVGGCVRDIFLNKKNFDLDIVIEGNAIALAKKLAKKKNVPLAVYNEFGTATLKWRGGLLVDLASARKETYAHSGALPKVQPGALYDDLFRRDFTANAIAVSINKARFGECVDSYGGIKDIRLKLIRVLHSNSFVDDPTRILRAVRFEQRFDFKIEAQTLRLLKSALAQRIEKNVKPARYFNEFRKILKEPSPKKNIVRLSRLKGLDFLKSGFRPPLKSLEQVEQSIKRLSKKDIYKEKDWSLVFLMSLVSNMKRPDIERFLQPLHLTSAERDSLLASLEAKQIVRKLIRPGLKPSEIYQVLRPVDLNVICFIRAAISTPRLGRVIDRHLKDHQNVQLRITGHDLAQLGVPAGAWMGEVLETVLLKKIDGKVKNRSEELKAAREMV